MNLLVAISQNLEFKINYIVKNRTRTSLNQPTTIDLLNNWYMGNNIQFLFSEPIIDELYVENKVIVRSNSILKIKSFSNHLIKLGFELNEDGLTYKYNPGRNENIKSNEIKYYYVFFDGNWKRFKLAGFIKYLNNLHLTVQIPISDKRLSTFEYEYTKVIQIEKYGFNCISDEKLSFKIPYQFDKMIHIDLKFFDNCNAIELKFAFKSNYSQYDMKLLNKYANTVKFMVQYELHKASTHIFEPIDLLMLINKTSKLAFTTMMLDYNKN